MRGTRGAKSIIFVISGPSGSGKSTLLARLVARRSLRRLLVKSVSLTTRPKRSKERQGRDYFFVSRIEFKRLLARKKILESTRYLGYDYGTPVSILNQAQEKSRSLLLCLDLKGALNIKRLYPQRTVLIFVQPPSVDELRSRIRKRCSKTSGREVDRRLNLARREMTQAARYDYRVMNEDLKGAVGRLKKIILKEIGNRSEE